MTVIQSRNCLRVLLLNSAVFEYLLKMPLWEKTLMRIKELREEKEKKEQDFEDLRETPKEDLWRRDLEQFLTKLDHSAS